MPYILGVTEALLIKGFIAVRAHIANLLAQHVATTATTDVAQSASTNYVASHVTQQAAQHAANVASHKGLQAAVTANSNGITVSTITQDALSAGSGALAAGGTMMAQ